MAEQVDPVETPQEFKYETRFVVLNYLGILPQFEEIEDESDDSDNKIQEEDDAEHDCAGIHSSQSQDTYSSMNNDNQDSEDYNQIRQVVAAAISASSCNQRKLKSSIPTIQFPKTDLKASRKDDDTLEGFKLAVDDIVPDSLSDPAQSNLVNSPSPAIGINGQTSLTISSSTSPRPKRISKKSKSKDLVEDMKKSRMQLVLEELEVRYKREMQEEGLAASGVLCAISREALVAERIAQIGDCIMMHHQSELEKSFHQVMGMGDGSLNYAVFKSTMKSLFKNTVPGWYHLAVMMKFTRRMALNMLDQGSRGVAAVTDYAAKYIEENLAEAILEQGGWDAVTNVDLEKIDSDTWSEISSGNPSPFHCSPMPASPPIYMDQSGYLSPCPSVLGQATGASTLNDMLGGRFVDRSNSYGTATTNDIFDGNKTQTDSSSATRHHTLSETDTGGKSGKEQEEPVMHEASRFGPGPIIATAATAAVAAVGAYALLKKL